MSLGGLRRFGAGAVPLRAGRATVTVLGASATTLAETLPKTLRNIELLVAPTII